MVADRMVAVRKQSVHDFGAGHGPVALTGAAAQRPRPHLIYRAGRQAGHRDGARLGRELDRGPRAGAGADLHLVTNRIGHRGEMHVQFRRRVVGDGGDGRRVQLHLRPVGARGLEPGREQHRQAEPADGLHVERQQIHAFDGEVEGLVLGQGGQGAAAFGGRAGRDQGVQAGGHVHRRSWIRRHRRFERDRRLGKRRVPLHAEDDPPEQGGHHFLRHFLVS